MMEKVWAQSDHLGRRKRPKYAKILVISYHWWKQQIFNGFGLFLGSHWSDWAQTFFIESGILIHKFRVATRGTLKNFEISIFFSFTSLEGTLGKIFLTRKLHSRYSIVIEHLIKHLQKIFSIKRGKWHTLKLGY